MGGWVGGWVGGCVGGVVVGEACLLFRITWMDAEYCDMH